ncbi:hypothetical protein B0H10DRAFT_2195733 [Mycena sp. CBHHK59/15]|nr:hypothetical protein B0H10DRAFT_2195733 [Mycena sp. CBHHK59/15]
MSDSQNKPGYALCKGVMRTYSDTMLHQRRNPSPIKNPKSRTRVNPPFDRLGVLRYIDGHHAAFGAILGRQLLVLDAIDRVSTEIKGQMKAEGRLNILYNLQVKSETETLWTVHWHPSGQLARVARYLVANSTLRTIILHQDEPEQSRPLPIEMHVSSEKWQNTTNYIRLGGRASSSVLSCVPNLPPILLYQQAAVTRGVRFASRAHHQQRKRYPPNAVARFDARDGTLTSRLARSAAISKSLPPYSSSVPCPSASVSSASSPTTMRDLL